MVDAWGGAWGSSWGVSWGSGVVPPVIRSSIPGGGDSSHRRRWNKAWLKWKHPELFTLPEEPEQKEATLQAVETLDQVYSYIADYEDIEWRAALVMLREAEKRVALRLVEADLRRAWYEFKKKIQKEAEDEESELISLLSHLRNTTWH